MSRCKWIIVYGVLFFLLIGIETIAQSETSVFYEISDSLLSRTWYNCKMMEAIDLEGLKREYRQKKTERSRLNLAIAKELKIIYEQEEYVNGLTKEKYAPHIEQLLKIGEEVRKKELYDIYMTIIEIIQLIYDHGNENEKTIEFGDRGIAYYKQLSREQKEYIKTAPWILSELYYNNLFVRSNQGDYSAAKTYYQGAVYWGKRAYNSSKKPSKSVVFYARSLLEIGNNFARLGEIDSAIFYIDKGIVEAAKQKHQSMLLALFLGKGNAYMFEENNKEALEVFLKMKDLANELDWHQGKLIALCSMAEINRLLQQHEKAMAYRAEVLALYQADRTVPLDTKIDVFQKIIELFEYQGKQDSVIFYTKKRLELTKLFQIPYEIFSDHIKLYKFYTKIKDSLNADRHYDQAAMIGSQIDHQGHEGMTILVDMGNYAFVRRGYKQAITYFKQALNIAESLRLWAAWHEISVKVCRSYIELNQIDSVRQYFELVEETNSQLYLKNQDSIALDLQEKYETKEKEAEIKRLNEKNELVEELNQLYIGVALLVFAVLLLVVYLYRRQKQTAQQLQQLQHNKDQLFSIIAHDLRTPFNALMNFSENLGQQLADKNLEELERSLLSIKRSSSSAYFLFENLLGWTKSQTGQISFEPCTVDIRESVAASLAILNSMVEFKNIVVVTQLEANWGVADRYMLNTIFRNLITNAIKHLNHGGTLKILSKKQKDVVLIEIRDNGVGMDKKTLQSLLEKRDQKKGLGILLCKDFVAKNGGEIGLDSTLGQGTIAWFTLPIARPLETDREEELNTKQQESTSPVLLAELSMDTKLAIQPVLEELKTLKVFYASEIYRVLKRIDITQNEELNLWKKRIDKSIKSIDEQFYEALLKQAEIMKTND